MGTGKKHRPQNRLELKRLLKDPSVSLGDIDTSWITNMSSLFQCSPRRDYLYFPGTFVT